MASPRAQPALLLLAAALASCGGADAGRGTDGDGTGADPSRRTYVMGFSSTPPRPDTALALRTIDLWARRADAALILLEPPWAALLAGEQPETLVRSDPLPLADHYRARGLRIVASIDPTDGLDRSRDSRALVAAGRSLADPAVRVLYARYVGAFASLVRPDYLGVASETNLIRAIARPELYEAVVEAAGMAVAEARTAHPGARLFVSVQVETAWGRLPPGPGFVGIARDRGDFAFVQALGLSSYPYLAGFGEPEELPLDYYARLVQDGPLPLIVVEGGWTSASVGSVTSSPEAQARYIRHQARLLDAARAAGVFQITFTDLDLSVLVLPPDSILPLFAALGLVDADLTPKPALAAWDGTFRRPLGP